MKLVDNKKAPDKTIEVYSEGNYEFEFWEKDGELIGPRINGKQINTVDESELLKEARKVYPNPSHKIRFTPIETEFE